MLVTVLMAVYDGEQYVEQAVESVLRQTLSDFELLVVDDGSTDGSAEILAEFQARDPRVRVVSQSHQGLVAALNLGLDWAEGAYVARMDADDVCVPTRLERQVAFMEAHPEVGVCGAWADLGDGRAMCHPESDEAIRAALLFDNLLVHPTVVFRHEVLERTGLRYPDVRHAEDYALWVALAPHTRFANVPEVLLHYRQHPEKVGLRHPALQERAVRRIRAEQLPSLGIEPGEQEIDLHQAIAEGSYRADRDFVREAGAWLGRLEAANAERRTFPAEEFRTVLARRWLALCWYAACNGGPWAAAAFRRSPLSKDPGVSRLERAAPAAGSLVGAAKRVLPAGSRR